MRIGQVGRWWKGRLFILAKTVKVVVTVPRWLWKVGRFGLVRILVQFGVVIPIVYGEVMLEAGDAKPLAFATRMAVYAIFLPILAGAPMATDCLFRGERQAEPDLEVSSNEGSGSA